MRDENGLEKCVACGLCSVACPADAIYLEAAENDGTVMAGPRYASIYQIHKTRCIFCGMCEEACPVSAIFMGKDYELAVYSKDDFIWDKADLLVAPPAGARAARELTPFLDALDERVLVCDGAMGTLLYAQGVFINRCFDALNLTDPDRVSGRARGLCPRRRGRRSRPIPSAPIASSCRRSASPIRYAISTAPGAQLARDGAGKNVYVAGAIGPLGLRIEPWGKTASDEAEAYFREQAQALVEGGVDLLMLETFRDVNEIAAAIARGAERLRAARRRADDDRGRRQQPRWHTAGAVRSGAAGGRSRCHRHQLQHRACAHARSAGADGRADAGASVRAAQRRPAARHRRTHALPDLARIHGVVRRRFLAARVRLVGGCCGTTPDHITPDQGGASAATRRSKSPSRQAGAPVRPRPWSRRSIERRSRIWRTRWRAGAGSRSWSSCRREVMRAKRHRAGARPARQGRGRGDYSVTARLDRGSAPCHWPC